MATDAGAPRLRAEDEGVLKSPPNDSLPPTNEDYPTPEIQLCITMEVISRQDKVEKGRSLSIGEISLREFMKEQKVA